MRPPTALFCLVLGVPLAGCITGAGTPELTPSAAAAPSSNPMPAGRAATAPRAPAGSSRPSSQAAAANASGNKEEWWQEGGVTREKINGMCWMKAEKAAGRSGSADKKADIVDKCVAETLKQYPVN